MVRSYRCSTTCELFCLADMFWNQRPVTSTYTADFWHHQWRSDWLHALSSGRDWEVFVCHLAYTFSTPLLYWQAHTAAWQVPALYKTTRHHLTSPTGNFQPEKVERCGHGTTLHVRLFYITLHVYQTHTASEFRSWMLYYCIPVLEGLLPPPYYDHLALLVCSMHILLGDNITSEGLSQTEGMLDEFYQKFEELHGKLASSCSFFLAL